MDLVRKICLCYSAVSYTHLDESFDMNMDMEAGAMDAQASPSFWSKYKVLIIAGAVAAAGAGVTAVVVIRKKRRAAKEEDVDDEIS